MSRADRVAETEFSLGTMHSGQAAAYWALQPYRFKALRCGRRFGKTDFGKIWIGQALLQGYCNSDRRQERVCRAQRLEVKIYAISTSVGARDRTSLT